MSNTLFKNAALRNIWLFAVLVFASQTSCVQSVESPSVPSDQATVMLTITTPQPSRPTRASSPSTRVQTEAEAHISKVRTLVFEQVGGSYVFRYHVAATEVGSTGMAQTRFKVMLRAQSVPLKLIVLTNSATDAFLAAAPEPGAAEAAVRASISLSFDSAGITGDLPMYGEVELPEGVAAASTNSLAVTVLRSIARVDVEKDLLPVSEEFTMEEIYIFRANGKIQVMPVALSSSADTPRVSTPSIPAGAALLSDPVTKSLSNTQTFTQIYIPECAAATTDTEKLTGTTVIVIGGRFKGGTNPVTYYRIDFDSGVPGHPFGQVLRNHRYIFKIKNVGSAGVETPEFAATTFSSAMQVEVSDWEDFSTDMYMDDDRFGVSTRRISLPYVGGRTGRVDVESSRPYSIQWIGSDGELEGNVTSAFNKTVSNANFDARIVKDTIDPANVTHVSLRTRTDNYNGSIKTDTLLLTSGKWKIKIIISQDNSVLYSNRSFNILSVATIGNLGITGDPASADGRAMRGLLDKQFALTGVVKIAGFNYNRVANDSNNIGATPARPAGWANMQLIIPRQDVIFLPYDVRISVNVASLILLWLAADTRRVLIVEADSQNTNANMLLQLSNDGTWTYSNISQVSKEYVRAAAISGTEPFFNGPFGAVAADAPINREDDIAGYSNNYGANVIPLIAGDKNADAMFFGINPNRRIIYHGDGHLFRVPQLSNTEGKVQTDADRLMCNLWAWIAVQLIYGDDLYSSDYAI